jgi:hypothetical protein
MPAHYPQTRSQSRPSSKAAPIALLGTDLALRERFAHNAWSAPVIGRPTCSPPILSICRIES